MECFCRNLFLSLLLILLLVTSVYSADYLHVFIYHRFGDARYPSTNISLANFEEQMRYLHEHNYQVISAGRAVELLIQKKEIPEKTVVLTVDDAYSTFRSGAMPILRRYGFPVTLFVNTDSVGSAGYLGWSELRQLKGEGVEIGNHTATHRSMTDRLRGEREEDYRRRLQGDINRAQEALNRELGIRPQLFAYPYGEYSQLAASIIKDYGFSAAFAQHSGVVGRNESLFSLPRTPLTGSYATLAQMKEKLTFRPMPVKLVAPADPLLDKEDPPAMILEMLDSQLDIRRLRLFVNGKQQGTIQVDPQNARQIIVRGANAFDVGRSKYILTAPGREPGTYYAFTQFWLKRSRP